MTFFLSTNEPVIDSWWVPLSQPTLSHLAAKSSLNRQNKSKYNHILYYKELL